MYQNQTQRIEQFLLKRGKKGVANWEFPAVLRILSYSRRITDLNKQRFEAGLPEVVVLRHWDNGAATGTFMYYLPKDFKEQDKIVKRWIKKERQ